MINLLQFPSWSPFMLAIIILWSLYWKGMALWRAAKQNDPWWFVFLLVINTLGILEIIYIYAVSKRKALHKEVSSQ